MADNNNVANYTRQANPFQNDKVYRGTTEYSKDAILRVFGDPALGESDYEERWAEFIKNALPPIVYIFDEADLGICDEGAQTITMSTGVYIMAASVVTEKRIIMENDSDIVFDSLQYFNFVLRYNSTGIFLTGSPRRFEIRKCLIIGSDLLDVPTVKPAGWPTDTPVNTLFDIDGSLLSTRTTVLFDWAQFAAFNNMGTINGFNTIAMQTANWSTYDTGLTISNGFDLLVDGGRISNVIDPGSSSGPAIIVEGFVFLGAVNGMLFTLNGDESAIKLDSSLVIVEAFGINNCPINTENGALLLDAAGLQKDNIRVQLNSNGQAPDSITTGVISMRENETVTPITADTPVKILGTAIEGFLERFSNGANRLTYIGVEGITLRVAAEIRVTFSASLQGDTITLYVVKNGDFANPIADDTSTLNAMFNNPTSPYLRAVDLVGDITTDDYFEAWIESDGDDDIVVESLNLLAEKVGA